MLNKWYWLPNVALRYSLPFDLGVCVCAPLKEEYNLLSFLKNIFDVDHFLRLYWICYNVAFMLWLLFFGCAHVGLSSLTRDWTLTPCPGHCSLNHRTTREVLYSAFFKSEKNFQFYKLSLWLCFSQPSLWSPDQRLIDFLASNHLNGNWNHILYLYFAKNISWASSMCCSRQQGWGRQPISPRPVYFCINTHHRQETTSKQDVWQFTEVESTWKAVRKGAWWSPRHCWEHPGAMRVHHEVKSFRVSCFENCFVSHSVVSSSLRLHGL